MTRRTLTVAALGGLAGLAGLAAGCAAGDGVTGASAGPPAAGVGADSPLSLEGAVRAARADAAHRTGLGPDTFERVSAERVTWSDGSLGCPQPGMAYTQALVPGYRVRLRGPAGLLDYHASRHTVFLCPPSLAVDPLPDAGRRT